MIVTTITSSAPYCCAIVSSPARTWSGVPGVIRRLPPITASPSDSRKRSACSTGGTAISRPRRSIAIAIRLEAVSRQASSSVSAASAQHATAVRGAASRTPGSKRRW